jgi:transposase InsO family protein
MKKHRYSHEFKVTAVKMATAYIESFFHTLKTEWIRGRTFATFAELETALTAYIRFYNHHRLHSGIDYHTPEEYERVTA